MNRDVFISYSRKNYDAVMEIKRQIDAATGTECWIDLKGIESGSEEFTDDIINGINNCKVFLFMLSEQSQESEWALRELRLAKKKNKRVVLVNIDGVEMNDRFFFNYSGSDIVYWKEQPQRDKLIGDLCRWIGSLGEGNGELSPFMDFDGYWGFRDKTGKLVIPCKWIYVDGFHEGLAGIKDSHDKWGFIDKTGRIVVPCEWDALKRFSEGLAGVMDSDGKWGFIDKTGMIVIPCEWDDATDFENGVAKVCWKLGVLGTIKRYTIDKTGKVIS